QAGRAVEPVLARGARFASPAAIPLTASSLDENPGQVIPFIADWLKQKRWFMGKNARLVSAEASDSFVIARDDEHLIVGLVATFHLEDNHGTTMTQRYFVPVILSANEIQGILEDDRRTLELLDGKRYLSMAEHHPKYQR